MQRLKQQLPPLDPLIAFEAAARHLSFTRAAEELNLSQAAVSQQIRNLEHNLGVSLFIRKHRTISLSPQGREYQHTVNNVLSQLANASEEIRELHDPPRLTIGADHSMASMWLIPNLHRFKGEPSTISVRVIASDEPADCLNSTIDIALIHGDGNWPGYDSEKLFDEEIFPVCSANYHSKTSLPMPVEFLTDETLLDLEDGNWDWMNWRTWLSQNQVNTPAYHRSLQINHYPLLIDAVKNGQGIALGWKFLVDRDLENGNLIRATRESIKTAFGYYLVWSNQQPLSEPATTFIHWCRHHFIQ